MRGSLPHGSTGSDFKTVEDEIGYWIDSRYHSRFLVRVGHKITHAAIANHIFFHSNISLSDLQRLLRTSLKPVHR